MKQMGHFAAVSAYLLWGLLPIYWKQLQEIPPGEIIVHRMVWTCLFCLMIPRARRALVTIRRDRRKLTLLILSSAIIGGNWLLYTWAVLIGQIKACSLGYFINPLLSIALGVVLLRERLRPAQSLAVTLAAAAVIYKTLSFGSLPWISLALAGSFAIYGLIRKLLPAGAVDGITVESSCMFLPALAWLLYQETSGQGHWSGNAIWLIGCGPVTALPLIAFAAAARHLPLSMLGYYQYIAPSCQLLLAVLFYGESIDPADWIVFPVIWLALGIITWDSWRFSRQPRATRPQTA